MKYKKIKPIKGDWINCIMEDKVKYDLNYLSDNEVVSMSKCSFKRLVEKKIRYAAFQSQIERVRMHSKSKQLLRILLLNHLKFNNI